MGSIRVVGGALAVATILLLGAGARAEPVDEPWPVAWAIVPEMAYIPEVDAWEWVEASTVEGHAAKFAAAWKTHRAWVEKRVSPRLVRELSRWAKPQMEGYDRAVLLDEMSFAPVARYAKQRKLVFEATIDTLPSHSPIVTRWLKLYVLYDEASETILRVTITIRGERLE